MLWTTSPACTELEQHVLDWLIEMLDLPATFHSSGDGGGVIQDTASSATLCALLAACYREQSDNPGTPGGLGSIPGRSPTLPPKGPLVSRKGHDDCRNRDRSPPRDRQR
ncbi:MAG: hypothetical protein Ct9H300mP1_28890 [Planctomycetaceae bacterium]|nr:MAG: hypothetical protein Ct9H300mP1_28890 [Planctomycetaceae bacterium]